MDSSPKSPNHSVDQLKPLIGKKIGKEGIKGENTNRLSDFTVVLQGVQLVGIGLL